MSNKSDVARVRTEVAGALARFEGLIEPIKSACPLATGDLAHTRAYLRAGLNRLDELLALPLEPTVDHSAAASLAIGAGPVIEHQA